MLHEFLTTNRENLITRCRAKVAKRPIPPPTAAELTYGIPIFLNQIIKTLRMEQTSDEAGSTRVSGEADVTGVPPTSEIGSSAALHGDELHRQGFTVDQVVHDYGDLCQAVTDLAVEVEAPITPNEFRTLNRCLDNAIADAVADITARATQDANERLGFLAHELRNKLNGARLAFDAIKMGTDAVGGATGAILDRSLLAMRDIVDRSFTEVRLGAGLSQSRERIAIGGLFEEIQVFAGMEAKAKGIVLTVQPVERALAVHADRHTLGSALSNLLQNAVKYTAAGGHVVLRARGSADRVAIEVEDECGGLPAGDPALLFRPFERRSIDRTGLGLGLSICQRGVEANGGKLDVRNKPGTGCVFIIDLPMAPIVAESFSLAATS